MANVDLEYLSQSSVSLSLFRLQPLDQAAKCSLTLGSLCSFPDQLKFFLSKRLHALREVFLQVLKQARCREVGIIGWAMSECVYEFSRGLAFILLVSLVFSWASRLASSSAR